ncbi:MAG: hypothetical protein AAFW75_04815 [Cyanobacteria bacterium J06636_16]
MPIDRVADHLSSFNERAAGFVRLFRVVKCVLWLVVAVIAASLGSAWMAATSGMLEMNTVELVPEGTLASQAEDTESDESVDAADQTIEAAVTEVATEASTADSEDATVPETDATEESDSESE